jgi:hypothetical protein
MNDTTLLATKLAELIELAREANTGFEKAAVFAAAKAIQTQFDEEEDSFDSYTLEKMSKSVGHILAIVGYDITNGHDKSQHISWAIGETNTLKKCLQDSLDSGKLKY